MDDTNAVAKNLSNINKEAVHPRAPKITMACPFSSSCHNNEQQAGLRRQPVLILTLYHAVFVIMVFHKPINYTQVTRKIVHAMNIILCNVML